MSFIQSTIKCKKCQKEMNVAFGIVGITQIAGWPEKCPNCGADKTEFERISEGWNAKD